MGTLILVIAFVIEVAFAAFCLVTKSRQAKVQSYIRIGALAAFLLFTLASIIQWGFRWYLLALLLLIWGALGIATLIRKRSEEETFRSGPVVGRAIGMLVLVFLASRPLCFSLSTRSPR